MAWLRQLGIARGLALSFIRSEKYLRCFSSLHSLHRTTFAKAKDLVLVPCVIAIEKAPQSGCFFYGSGSWARTSDLIVTHNHMLSHTCGLSHHPFSGCGALFERVLLEDSLSSL